MNIITIYKKAIQHFHRDVKLTLFSISLVGFCYVEGYSSIYTFDDLAMALNLLDW